PSYTICSLTTLSPPPRPTLFPYTTLFRSRKKTARTILLFSQNIRRHPTQSIRISRSDLASVAGMASETLIRTLSDFKKEGLLEIEGRNIKLLNVEALKKIS